MTVPQKQDEALSGMLEVVEDVKKNGISPEDLERTKVSLMGTHAIDLQTNSQLAGQAAFDELYGLGYNDYQNYDKNIRAVTAEDIQRVASKYLDLNHYALVTVGDVEGSAK